MAVPDRSSFVREFLAPRLSRAGTEVETRARSFDALNACALALRRSDGAAWGLLEKTSGDHVKSRAADILLFNLGDGTAQVIDVIGDAEGHDGTPAPGWSLKDIRPVSQWRAPFDEPQPGPVDPVTADPPPAGAAASAELQRQQIALLTQIVAALGRQNEQAARLEAAIAALRDEIAGGIRLRE